MFGKYFEMIKALFEAVFSSGGESVKFTDYLYILGFTFALIVVAVITIIVLFYIVKLPFIVYRRITRKIKEEINELEQIIMGEDCGKDTEELPIIKSC